MALSGDREPILTKDCDNMKVWPLVFSATPSFLVTGILEDWGPRLVIYMAWQTCGSVTAAFNQNQLP